MIDLALHYARSGWPVFPLAPGGKEPLVSRERGGHGCLDATLDLNRVEGWWRAYPEANIGIATGRRSGLLVIDVDPRKTDKWLESLHELALPPTFTVKTASGGWHLYLKWNGEPARITIGAALLPGIDWRGNRGYVVGAGSIVNRATYEIAKNLAFAQAPESLLQRLCTQRKSRPIKSADGHMVIADGARNETLFALACLLRRFGIEFNAIYQSLRAANTDHCQPPVADEELRQIAASAERYAPKESA